MIKHGISHAVLALTAVISGEIISQRIMLYWPEIEHTIALKLQPLLHQYDWNLDTHRIGVLITIALFGFVWGATFKSMSD
jgi:hypothetical protein